jgi:hypothetical protein
MTSGFLFDVYIISQNKGKINTVYLTDGCIFDILFKTDIINAPISKLPDD